MHINSRLLLFRFYIGQERFRTLTTAYYRGAMGILLMYDVTSLESYNNLSYWLRNIQEVSDSISVARLYLIST